MISYFFYPKTGTLQRNARARALPTNELKLLLLPFKKKIKQFWSDPVNSQYS